MTRFDVPTKRDQPERRERLAFMRWLSFMPKIRKYMFAIENGGSRNEIEAANIKKMGLVAGVPDYFFMWPTRKYHGLWIEFKAGKNDLTDNQAQFFKTAEEVAYKCIVVWSWEDAKKEIEEYLK